MNIGTLGIVYQDGEIILRQGDEGDRMYVIQEGRVEILKEIEDVEIRLAIREKGDFFGEMAIFEHEVRLTTVRALGEVRLLTIDRKNFLRRIHEDPSLAYGVVQTMSHRIRELSSEVTQLRMILENGRGYEQVKE